MAKRRTPRSTLLPERLPDGSALSYAPVNEIGVVYLFTQFAKKWRLEIDQIRGAFPDCIAHLKTGEGRRELRIEFEYRSSGFRRHGHDPKGCDWIVCWKHDWRGAPQHLEVKELRAELGLGFNVWVCAVAGASKDELSSADRHAGWSVPRQARKGDLILFYKTSPHRQIEDAFRVVTAPQENKASWRKGLDFFSRIHRVASIRSPLRLEDMKRKQGLATAGFVRGSFRGKYRATEHWPDLLDAISARDPRAGHVLRRYVSARLPG
jgi:hypothetical protein